MVKLHCGGVLEKVSHAQARVPNLFRNPPPGHERKVVVRAPGVIARHKCARQNRHAQRDCRHFRRPAKSSQRTRQLGIGQQFGLGCGSLFHGRPATRVGRSSQQIQPGPQQQPVRRKRHRQVRCQAVRADAGRVVLRALDPKDMLVVKARLHHPPSNRALHATHAKQYAQAPVQVPRDLATSRKVDHRSRKAHSDGSPPHAMAPFPIVYALELVECHRHVEAFELGEVPVLFEFDLPLGRVHRRQPASTLSTLNVLPLQRDET